MSSSSAIGFARARARASPARAKTSRRSSILKRPDTTPDRENSDNFAGSSKKDGKDKGGERKRRVSFSHTVELRTFNADERPTTTTISKPLDGAGVVDKRLPLQLLPNDAIPRLQDLLEDEGPVVVSQFQMGAEESRVEEQPLATDEWGGHHTRNFTVTMDFTGQPQAQPQPHAVSLDSIFGEGIDESAILPARERTEAVDATLDRWHQNASPGRVRREMEMSAALPPVLSLDSKTMDTSQAVVIGGPVTATLDDTGAPATITAAPLTTRIATNMSGVEEEDEKDDNGDMDVDDDNEPPKTVHIAAPMEIDEEDDDEDVHLAGNAAPLQQQHFLAGPLDMSHLPVAEMGAKTVNVSARMDVEEDDDDDDEEHVAGAVNSDEDELPAPNDLNEGFTKDWAGAAATTGARTVNFAMPMDIDEDDMDVDQEDQEAAGQMKKMDRSSVVMMEDDEDVDDVAPVSWGIKAFEGPRSSHMAAADAVRKSLEMGEVMGRTSLTRKSLDRKSFERTSFGRASSSPMGQSPRAGGRGSLEAQRESLNRSSLLLSPVEETAEHEEEEDNNAVAHAHVPQQPKAVAPPSMESQQPQKRIAAPVSAAPAPSSAAVVAAVPESKLPSLFERRYSTRRVIQNFGRHSSFGGAAASAAGNDDNAENAVPAGAEALRKMPRLDAAASSDAHHHEYDEASFMEESHRRASMRHSIAPGELPLADFLWLAAIRFSDDRPVENVSALVADIPDAASSLVGAEIQTLQRELKALMEQADSLHEAIENEEEALSGTSNPLFSAIQTTDQGAFADLQVQLSCLKRICAAEAEIEVVEASKAAGAALSQSVRQVGEYAIQDVKRIAGIVSQMQSRREELRAAKLSLADKISVFQEQAKQRKRKAASQPDATRQLLMWTQIMSHCQVLSRANDRLELLVCETLKVSMQLSANGKNVLSYSCSLVESCNAWRANLIRAAGFVADGFVKPVPANSTVESVVSLFRTKLLRVNAATAELRKLSRRFNTIYTNDAVELYFCSKTSMCILRIPCETIASYPEKQPSGQPVPTVSVLKSQNSTADLEKAVAQGLAFYGSFAAMSAKVESEFEKL